MHGHQAIVFLQLHISAVDREVHHSKHKTTPFLFEAGRPGGRVRAHTLRPHEFRKFRSCARDRQLGTCRFSCFYCYIYCESVSLGSSVLSCRRAQCVVWVVGPHSINAGSAPQYTRIVHTGRLGPLGTAYCALYVCACGIGF